MWFSISHFPLQGRPFSYGFNGNAKYQLRSLASKSRVALQTLEYNCNKGRSAHRLIGHNGVEISVQESSQSLLQTVNVEHNCEVCKILMLSCGRVYIATCLFRLVFVKVQ